MKATVTKENFKKIISLVSHIVSGTSTLPILSNILFQTDKGRIKISATNLEIGLTAWLGGKVEKEGSFTIPARTINDYVSTTMGEQVALEAQKNELTISTESSEAKIKTLPAEEFPLIPQFKPTGTLKFTAKALKTALFEVAFAAAQAETQPELAGIYIYTDDKNVYFVSTDRYRLTERALGLDEVSLEGEFKPIIVPQRTVMEIVRVLSSVDPEAEASLGQGENQVSFKMQDIELVSRLVDSSFPDYKQIIPANFNSEAKIPRYDLVQAIKSAGLFATATRSIKLSFNPDAGQVEIFAASGDIGESRVKVPGEIKGPQMESTFNYRYLLDYLNTIPDEEVVFKTVNDQQPALIEPQGRSNNRYIVMPIKA